MDNSKDVEFGFLIELVISGEADEQQCEEVMTQVETDPKIAALYRQACAQRELMGSEIAQEALDRSRDCERASEKPQEEIKRKHRRYQNLEL